MMEITRNLYNNVSNALNYTSNGSTADALPVPLGMKDAHVTIGVAI